jgi:hypothetical protein
VILCLSVEWGGFRLERKNGDWIVEETFRAIS